MPWLITPFQVSHSFLAGTIGDSRKVERYDGARGASILADGRLICLDGPGERA